MFKQWDAALLHGVSGVLVSKWEGSLPSIEELATGGKG